MTPTKTPKRTRTRLAKSELLLALACTASRWGREVTGEEEGVLPFEEWPASDFFRDLARRYDLKPADLQRVMEQLAEQLENRAMSAGYDEAWLDGRDPYVCACGGKSCPSCRETKA